MLLMSCHNKLVWFHFPNRSFNQSFLYMSLASITKNHAHLKVDLLLLVLMKFYLLAGSWLNTSTTKSMMDIEKSSQLGNYSNEFFFSNNHFSLEIFLCKLIYCRRYCARSASLCVCTFIYSYCKYVYLQQYIFVAIANKLFCNEMFSLNFLQLKLVVANWRMSFWKPVVANWMLFLS